MKIRIIITMIVKQILIIKHDSYGTNTFSCEDIDDNHHSNNGIDDDDNFNYDIDNNSDD